MPIDKPFSVLVADDEPLARERLVGILAELRENGYPIGHVHSVEDGEQAFSLISSRDSDSSERPDWVVFLDVRMPGINGLELARHLSKIRRSPVVVFCTAHDEHAVEAFETNAIDYILKPARKERVASVFSKLDSLAGTLAPHEQVHAISRLRASGQNFDVFANPEQPLFESAFRHKLSVSERGRVRLIPFDDVLYFKAELKYTTIRTVEKEFLTEEPLVSLETEFGDRLLRIHRNCLIPRSRLRGFERNRGEESGWVAVLEGCPDKLSVSRRQWTQIRESGKF